MENNHLTETRYTDFDLSDALQSGILDAGYTHCTPIQAASLPLSLSGKDVAGQAQTGTGKTAAFLVTMINRLLTTPAPFPDRTDMPRGFIMAPTRELAVQIYKDAKMLAGHTELKIGVIYGGEGYEAQREILKEGLDILIGTPGRTIDFFKQGLFKLKGIDCVVIDEADRMFDLGFIKDIRFLLRRMPEPDKRLNMLFSATLSHRVMELSYEHMNNPERVQIAQEKITTDKIDQSVYYTANDEKIPLLIGLLKSTGSQCAIVFVNRKDTAQRIDAFLRGNGFKAGVISGDISQKRRLSLLTQFQQGELHVLVATDIAARGLHINGITHVFNFDLPHEAEDYVHRIGRTARAGASGHAISFACEDYSFSLPEIEDYLKHKIPLKHIQATDLVTPLPPAKQEPRNTPHHKSRSPRKHDNKRRPHRHS